ncbi:MAG: helix-turn-helix domain-containing protein [Nitrospira sp.]|nr:helix-turn-helix domain-containing protein [Nitrospira sp.]
MRPLTLYEAAQFLRMSRSSLYQRKDIPRYRRPGSRTLLFDQDELEAWVRSGRIEPVPIVRSASPFVESPSSGEDSVTLCAVPAGDGLDIQGPAVYHRNPRYR